MEPDDLIVGLEGLHEHLLDLKFKRDDPWGYMIKNMLAKVANGPSIADIMSVQPMAAPTSKVFFMDYVK